MKNSQIGKEQSKSRKGGSTLSLINCLNLFKLSDLPFPMKSLKEIKELILKGDIKKLFNKDSKEKFHPSEIAALLNSVSLNEAWGIFDSFIEERQVTVFPFLGAYLQRERMKICRFHNRRSYLMLT